MNLFGRDIFITASFILFFREIEKETIFEFVMFFADRVMRKNGLQRVCEFVDLRFMDLLFSEMRFESIVCDVDAPSASSCRAESEVNGEKCIVGDVFDCFVHGSTV